MVLFDILGHRRGDAAEALAFPRHQRGQFSIVSKRPYSSALVRVARFVCSVRRRPCRLPPRKCQPRRSRRTANVRTPELLGRRCKLWGLSPAILITIMTNAIVRSASRYRAPVATGKVAFQCVTLASHFESNPTKQWHEGYSVHGRKRFMVQNTTASRASAS